MPTRAFRRFDYQNTVPSPSRDRAGSHELLSRIAVYPPNRIRNTANSRILRFLGVLSRVSLISEIRFEGFCKICDSSVARVPAFHVNVPRFSLVICIDKDIFSRTMQRNGELETIFANSRTVPSQGTSENQRGKDELAETIKFCDQISARVSSGKCIPCSSLEQYKVWIIKRAGSRLRIKSDSISRR